MSWRTREVNLTIESQRRYSAGAAPFTVFVKGAGFAMAGPKIRTLENRKGAAPTPS
jgi:hypothetical protein